LRFLKRLLIHVFNQTSYPNPHKNLRHENH
jgi:hypothetical protein